MPPLKHKLFLPIIIVLSVLLSGCQFTDQLKSLTNTQQVKKADSDWLKAGNTFQTTVNYESPGGQEINKFHITLEGGVITNVEIEVFTEIDASIRYQQQFAKELPPLLIGKKLSDITVIDKVSGASLTTKAFNDALLKLKNQLES